MVCSSKTVIQYTPWYGSGFVPLNMYISTVFNIFTVITNLHYSSPVLCCDLYCLTTSGVQEAGCVNRVCVFEARQPTRAAGQSIQPGHCTAQ